MSAPGRTTPGFGRSGFSMGARFLLLADRVHRADDARPPRPAPRARARSVIRRRLSGSRARRPAVQHVGKTARYVRRARRADRREPAVPPRAARNRGSPAAARGAREPRTRGCASCSIRRRASVAARSSPRFWPSTSIPYRQRFDLNRGLVDGVYVGQALIDAQGVVGQVVRVGPLTSEAVLITDADHAVPVSVNRNGVRTIAVGTGDSGRLRLPYLTNNADIVVGDLLISSGLGRRVPGRLSGRPRARGAAAARPSVRRDHRRARVGARPRSRSAARVECGATKRRVPSEAAAASVADVQ